jgi:antitoxin CptB
MTYNRELIIKKLLYRSNNRGCKETDILLGSFANNHLNQLNEQDLLEYSNLLEQPDNDIYNWITNKSYPDQPFIKIISKINAEK